MSGKDKTDDHSLHGRPDTAHPGIQLGTRDADRTTRTRESLANHTHKQSELYARCTHGPSVLSPEDRAGEEKHEQAEGEGRKDVNEAEPRWPLPASLSGTAPASSTSRARPQQGTLTLTPSTPPGGNRRGKTTPLTSLLTSCKNGGGRGGNTLPRGQDATHTGQQHVRMQLPPPS